jgi:hypothetical protein
MLARNWGRSIIVPGQDQNYVRTAYSPEDLDKDKGVPQIYYCHNVMPCQEGLQSIGYVGILPSAGYTGFKEIFILRDDSDNKAFLGVRDTGAGNQFWISDGTGAAWIQKPTWGPGLVTTAYISGVTYIFVEGYACFTYNFITTNFDLVYLKGVNYLNITGICAAAGYMILWTKGVPAKTVTVAAANAGDYKVFTNTVSGVLVGASVTGTGVPSGTFIYAVYQPGDGGPAIYLTNPVTTNITSVTWTIGSNTSIIAWSSTTDPTDFIPSAITGAGGGPVEAAKGSINYCIAHTLGFIIGTADNCIAALYQNNQLFPFQFREIVNSGGMTSLDLVSYDANTSGLYSYTTSGLQLINTQQTQTVNTEITDFISGSNFEDFDDTALQLVETHLTSPMVKRLAVVVDRYLCVSYGISSLTHIIIYDLVTKRYGKLKIPHVQVFTYHLVATGTLEAPRQSIAILQTNGTVTRVDFDISSTTSSGTLVLGKYQYVRARLMTLDTIALDSVNVGETFNLTLMTALDGKNTVNTTPVLTYSNGYSREYSMRDTGINHSICMQGGFMLDSLVLQFHIHGKR